MICQFPRFPGRRVVASFVIAVAVVAAHAFWTVESEAGCNIIPGTTKSFRGQLGNVDRPFAGRDTWVEINVASPCHSASLGFSDNPADHNVTVVFKAPSGTSNVVTLSTDCGALAGALATCGATAGVTSATCLNASVDLPPFDLDVLTRDGERNLRFRFPDTDALVGQNADDVTFAGPAAIAVTGIADALPCGLATQTCAQQSGLTACVDELYEDSGSCSSVAHKMFTHFTSLPPANSYQALCNNPSPPCTGTAEEVRFAIDREGNLLLPMDWRGVLIGDNVPIARLLRGSSPLEPFSVGSGRIVIPGDDFLSSLSPEGALLPPVFDPQFSPSSQTSAVLFGSTDATETILRVSRRSPNFTQCTAGVHDGLPCAADTDCPDGSCAPTVCSGGANAGQACMADSDCPSGECGPSLFDFSDRLEAGVGPVVVRRFTDPGSSEQGVCEAGPMSGQTCHIDPDCGSGTCVRYTGEALNPVPLTGLAQTESISSFVVSESDAAADFNGDGDIVDNVATLTDRASGVGQPLGAPQGCGMTGGAEGRAVALVQQPPFSFPAVTISEDVIAMLESEADQNQCDQNQDGDTDDAILRVFRLGQTETINAALSPARAADLTPQVNGRALAISGGRLFFRSSEVGGQADYNGDGNTADTVLEVLDLATGSITTLCPSLDVAASYGISAFLRPESSTGTSACPAGSLNADADLDDSVVYIWKGAGDAENSGRAATRVSISDQWVGVTVSEAAEGADLNNDGDTLDDVAALNRLSDPATLWTNLATAADALELASSVAVFITPESQQGGTDLNGDGDVVDRVLQVYYADTGETINVGQSAEEFVIGEGAVGFRTKESDQSADLNGDGDTSDEIFQLFEVESRILINTRQTVMPCNLEACDPRTPYRVLDDTARFLSSEWSEGKDLNGDGVMGDVVIRVFNIAMALANPDLSTLMVANGMRHFKGTMTFGNLVVPGMITSVSSVPAGPGQDINGLDATMRSEDGALAYVNAGRCVEVFDKPCSASAPCRSGEFCNPRGLCEREHGVCLGDQHCPPGAQCVADLIAATAADSDGDELPDPFDNCPSVANVLQTDMDKDGIGDACASSCGNSVRDAGEQCDTGTVSDHAGGACRTDCKLSLCGDPLAEGETTAASALYVLRSAVGLSNCVACVCDVDGTGDTNASDALMALNQAISAGSTLRCPACAL